MRNNIPDSYHGRPNPAIAAILLSSRMRALMFEKAEVAQALYRETVAKRTGRLARSARVETYKSDDRWHGRLIVEATYAASHEFGTDDGDEHITAAAHDLNRVLNAMNALS